MLLYNDYLGEAHSYDDKCGIKDIEECGTILEGGQRNF